MPTIRAVGVANPKAQGQAMTNTETAESNPKESAFSPPKTIQEPKVRMEIPKTTGTKMLDTLSTSRCTGALLPWASCTRWMIWASRVVLPIFSAVISRIPFWLRVPANTGSPGPLATGRYSPLSMLSSK